MKILAFAFSFLALTTLPNCSSGPSDQHQSLTDPCRDATEFACITDPTCQPVYVTDPTTNSTRAFVGCRTNPTPTDPCDGLDQAACGANPACVAQENIGGGVACDCPADAGDCGCPPPPPVGFECRQKTCSDYGAAECALHPECTSGVSSPPGCACAGDAPCNCPLVPAPSVDGGAGVDGGTDFGGCFEKFFGCSGMDEATCLAHGECHAVGGSCYCPADTSCACSGGKFLFCEPDDGIARCHADSDCGSEQRCSTDDVDGQCAPPIGSGGLVPQPVGFGAAGGGSMGAGSIVSTPGCAGLCVPKGCAGYSESHCNADPSCEPVYELECSPYGGGGGIAPDCGGPLPPNAGAPAPTCGNGCDPTFVRCIDDDATAAVDPDKSVLIRAPAIVDDPAFAFPAVMAALAGGHDVNAFVTAWLTQIAQPTSASGKLAAARSGAAAFFAGLPRRSDGTIDVAQLGFQTTALSNRMDLASPNDCGEARLTYALAGGVTDRRHRMTVIVELKQPDDGAACADVARGWVTLSQLGGAALADAVRAIYAPLLSPAHLGQVRTNEFLVGPMTSPDPTQNAPWELREWRLGSDGNLHLALSKQALDPQLGGAAAFDSWLQANRAQVVAQTATLPDAYLAVSSSENGSRIALADGEAADALNKMACAGCHTTESNTAFTHVGERFQGTGRAQISTFLQDQLRPRTAHLMRIALGQLTAGVRSAIKPTH
jgi:hypothetical protein